MDKFPAIELRTSTRTARPAAALWARRLSESPKRVDLAINPRQVLYTLIAIIAALALASTAAPPPGPAASAA